MLHTESSAALRGMRIVTSWHDYPAAILGYTERKLTDWLLANARPGETWLDVGTNCGYTSLAMPRAVGPGGRVFAFDRPWPPRPAWKARAAPTASASSSPSPSPSPTAAARRLSVRDRPGNDRLADDPDGRREMIAIIAVGLDAIWEGIAAGNPTVHGIKIDVQGMELEPSEACDGCCPGIGRRCPGDPPRRTPRRRPRLARRLRLPPRPRADRRNPGCLRRPAEQRQLHVPGEPVPLRRPSTDAARQEAVRAVENLRG